MAVFLSLLTAAIYGTADFCGGLAVQRAKLLQVVAGAHLVGLVGVVVTSVLVADEFDGGDFLLGAAGGAFGAVAIALLYRRLAIGPMQVPEGAIDLRDPPGSRLLAVHVRLPR